MRTFVYNFHIITIITKLRSFGHFLGISLGIRVYSATDNIPNQRSNI